MLYKFVVISGKLEAASVVHHVPRSIERIMVSEIITVPKYSLRLIDLPWQVRERRFV